MCVNYPLRNAQTQTAAFHGVIVRSVASKKAVKDSWKLLMSDARPCIINSQFGSAIAAAEGHDHSALQLIVFDSVVREV